MYWLHRVRFVLGRFSPERAGGAKRFAPVQGTGEPPQSNAAASAKECDSLTVDR